MSGAMPTESESDLLADPSVRRTVEDFVRRRVPASDVDDVVQTVLCDALAAEGRPRERSELTRWLIGIARHKVVDRHRRAQREPAAEIPDIEEAPPPLEARELVRWAEEQAGSTRDAQKTLAWMAREGEGEKLESIAADEKLPAARVRQRVSRMRRWMRERWMAELAAVAALSAIILGVIWWLRRISKPETDAHPSPTIQPEPPSPLDRARSLRAEAAKQCDERAWRECLKSLDDARALDPIGDGSPEVRALRGKAEDALREPAPAPTSSATSAPTISPSSTATPSPIDKPLDKKSDPIETKVKPAPPPITTSTPTAPPSPKAPYLKKASPTKSGKPFANPWDDGKK